MEMYAHIVVVNPLTSSSFPEKHPGNIVGAGGVFILETMKENCQQIVLQSEALNYAYR